MRRGTRRNSFPCVPLSSYELFAGEFDRPCAFGSNDRRVVGIITDGGLIKRATETERDGIVQSLARRLPLGQSAKFHLSGRVAAEVMTGPVITVTPDTSLLEALRLLLAHRIKRLPVVDANGRLVGLVGRGGVLQALSQELGT